MSELFQPRKYRQRRVRSEPGDVFLIAQTDGLITVGQVLDCPNRNIATIALYSPRIAAAESLSKFVIATQNIIGAVSTTSDQLQDKVWPIVDRRPVQLERRRWPNEATRSRGWVGMRVNSSGLVCEFLEAYYGLALWDDWYDPDCLSEFLFESVPRPPNVRLKNQPQT